jgi:hypothetical protein
MDVKKLTVITVLAGALLHAAPPAGADKTAHREDSTKNGIAVLWHEPADISSRNLFYGPGGAEHQPQAPYKFVKEDLEGTTPKFVVTDGNGVKWKVKLDVEARPETVASRIAWSVGYYTNEDYFLASMQVQNMPPRLHRGRKLVAPDGTVTNVRLKRESKDEKKVGLWHWRLNPFTGSRELNGLKVVMATINNWDLKDVNNAIYRENNELVYAISDLGASFGTAGPAWPHSKAKGNIDSYMQSKFIRTATADRIDFRVPARPAWRLLVNPKEYLKGVHLEWVCRDIPRADARWMGQLLARLSPEQIRDAFRSAGYSPEEVEEFVTVMEGRITVLTDL